MNVGDLILYVAFALALITILLLTKGVKSAKWFSRVFALLLSADLLLLIYYFTVSEITVNYVWTFTSRDLSMLYKVLGAFAGQQGTLLYWSFLIGLQTLWLSERSKQVSDFATKTHIVMLAVGLYFIGLTLLDSPFLTIYDVYPEIPASFVPEDGAGLNPLLITPWMAVHPPVIFLGYAMTTLPFAAAVVYLFRSVRSGGSEDVHRVWVRLAVPWARVSWLLLTAGIAIGAVWSYEVLGWGGFWAWDPVETASLVPWLLLTAALHSMADHSGNRRKFSILTPFLIALSFVSVVLAALVTRSGFFNSVHAFSSGSVATYLLALTGVGTFSSIVLAYLVYLRSKKIGGSAEELSFVNRTNIFYLAISSLVILTFISFWGIIFPAVNSLIIGTKIGLTREFFDIWSAPFMISVMLLIGLGINYRHSKKQSAIKTFLFYTAVTLVAVSIKPSEAFTYIQYTSVTGPEKPFLYTLIGSSSILGIIPPTIYIFDSAFGRVWDRVRPSKRRDDRIKQIGIVIIHLGVGLIVLGWVFSTNFTAEFSTSLSVQDEGKMRLIPQTPYSIELLDYSTDVRYREATSASGLDVTEFYRRISDDRAPRSIGDIYTVYGRVDEVMSVDNYTYIKLAKGGQELWIATEDIDFPQDATIIATGTPLFNFRSAKLNKTFTVLIFSPKEGVTSFQREIVRIAEQIRVAVYEGHSKTVEGTAESARYEQQDFDLNKVMIGRGALRDVYIIFTGTQGGVIPLTLKIIPLMSWLWLGIALMMVGITLTLLFDPRLKMS